MIRKELKSFALLNNSAQLEHLFLQKMSRLKYAPTARLMDMDVAFILFRAIKKMIKNKFVLQFVKLVLEVLPTLLILKTRLKNV